MTNWYAVNGGTKAGYEHVRNTNKWYHARESDELNRHATSLNIHSYDSVGFILNVLWYGQSSTKTQWYFIQI